MLVMHLNRILHSLVLSADGHFLVVQSRFLSVKAGSQAGESVATC